MTDKIILQVSLRVNWQKSEIETSKNKSSLLAFFPKLSLRKSSNSQLKPSLPSSLWIRQMDSFLSIQSG